MPSPFSAILRSINAPIDRKLNILCANNHEAYSFNLAKTGHNFYFLQHPRFHQWDQKESPYPNNCIPLTGNDFQEQIKNDIEFDLVLSQNRIEHYPIMAQIAQKLGCPLVSMEHTLPWPDWPDEVTEQQGKLLANVDIFVSSFSVEAWKRQLDDPRIHIIHHGIDTEFYDEWVGGDKKVMTAVWDYANRNKICGFDLYRQVTEGLATNPWGHTPGLSVMANNKEHLREQYRNASVFLNTTIWSSCPFSLLEAMSVGCPIVTTATTMMPEFIEDGVNGFISNDPITIRERLVQLIKDPELGAKIGEAGRQTVLDMFGIEKFVANWNKALYAAADKPCELIVR